MKTKAKINAVKSYAVITFGVFLMAVGIYFFKFPNNFSTGGVSGISTILGEIVPNMSKGDFVTIINVILLALGLVVFGKDFAFKTVYAKGIDPHLFMITTNSSDILGKGFRENVG